MSKNKTPFSVETMGVEVGSGVNVAVGCGVFVAVLVGESVAFGAQETKTIARKIMKNAFVFITLPLFCKGQPNYELYRPLCI